MANNSIVGRLAPRRWQVGDPLPDVGLFCLVSGVNCDVESDQHRSYMWRKVVGYSDDSQFVCLQTEGCWPTVERTDNCWFAETDGRRLVFEREEVARGNNVARDDGGLYLNQFVQERWEDYAAEKPADPKITFLQQFDDSKKRAAKLRAMYPALSVGSIDKQAEPVGDERAALELWRKYACQGEKLESTPYHAARAAMGTNTEVQDKGLYLAIQAYLRSAQSGQRAGDEVQALRDMLDDARTDIQTIQMALGVPYEPHQSLMERTLEMAEKAGQRAGVAEVPKGWALVPIEPTPHMAHCGGRVAASGNTINGYGKHVLTEFGAQEVWRAMLAAAPTPAAQGGV